MRGPAFNNAGSNTDICGLTGHQCGHMCPTGMRGAAHDCARRTLRRLPVVSVPHMPAVGRVPPGAPPGAQVRSPSRATPVGRHGAWLYATPTAPPFGPDALSGPSHLRRPRAHQGPPWTCPASWPDLCARASRPASPRPGAPPGAPSSPSVSLRAPGTQCVTSGHMPNTRAPTCVDVRFRRMRAERAAGALRGHRPPLHLSSTGGRIVRHISESRVI